MSTMQALSALHDAIRSEVLAEVTAHLAAWQSEMQGLTGEDAMDPAYLDGVADALISVSELAR